MRLCVCVFHYERTSLEYSERPVRFITVKLILEGLEEESGSGEILQQSDVGRGCVEEGKVVRGSFPEKVKLG